MVQKDALTFVYRDVHIRTYARIFIDTHKKYVCIYIYMYEYVCTYTHMYLHSHRNAWDNLPTFEAGSRRQLSSVLCCTSTMPRGTS